jgi:hypothetical protein
MTGSPPGTVGQPKRKKKIILHVRIDPEKKVRNGKMRKAHQEHGKWKISLFRLK